MAYKGFLAAPLLRSRAQLQRVRLFLLFNHPSGFFAEAESDWYFQQNFGSAANLPGDSFSQLSAFLGYRFPRLHGDITLGVLNITDEDYRVRFAQKFAPNGSAVIYKPDDKGKLPAFRRTSRKSIPTTSSKPRPKWKPW